MARISIRKAAALAAAVAFADSVPLGQPPLTPGRVALMVTAPDAETSAAFGPALTDPDPNVRLLAARAVMALARTDLLAAVGAQLARETDPRPAAEQARVLLNLEGMRHLPAVEAAATRLGSPVPQVLAEYLGRGAPQVLAARLGDLSTMLPDHSAQLHDIIAMALHQHPAAAERLVAAALALADGKAWEAVLRAVGGGERGEAAVAAGLAASDPLIRERTSWYVIARLTAGSAPSLPPLTMSGPGGPPETDWGQVGSELLARHRDSSHAVRDVSKLLLEHAAAHKSEAQHLRDFAKLTDAERRALHTVLGEPPSRRQPLQPNAASAPIVSARRSTLRTLRSLVGGYLQSTLDAAGCKVRPGDDRLAGARIAYRPDGRPRQVMLDEGRLPKECARALQAFAMLAVADAGEPVFPDEWQWILMPMDQAMLACADAQPPLQISPFRVGQKIQPPRRIRNRNPVYPAAAQKERIQGLVILEATIATTGCVKDVRVLRGVNSALDVAAMHAVLGWQFTPTAVDGEPVPVVMTVTVSFTLD